MPNVGIVTESHLDMWNDFLNESDVSIDGDVERLYDYVRYIHTMSPRDKGIDLGNTIIIIDSLQGAITDLNTSGEANRISGECNDRVTAHILYNKEIHNLDFINGCDDIYTMRDVLINGAVRICAEAEADTQALDIGIKFVDFMSEKILN